MRWLLLFILLLPAAIPAQVYHTQDFEGTGTPTDWTSAVGTPDYDYTADALEGDESLYLNGASGTKIAHVVYVGEVLDGSYTAFRVKWSTATPSAPFYTQQWYANTNQNGYWGVNTSGKIFGTHGATTETSDYTITPGTLYYAWGHYVKAVSGDGILEVWVSTTGYFSDAEKVVDITTGTDGGSTDRIYFTCSGTTLGNTIVDDFEVSATMPGDFYEPQAATVLPYDGFEGFPSDEGF